MKPQPKNMQNLTMFAAKSGSLRYDPSTRTRGRAWMAIRASILRESPLCIPCKASGRITLATQIDHIIPLFKGGTDDRNNLQPLCDQCHHEKTRDDMGYKSKPSIQLNGQPLGWK